MECNNDKMKQNGQVYTKLLCSNLFCKSANGVFPCHIKIHN